MVNVSSENNLISVDVSTSGNKANINVSGSNNNTNVSATPDLSMFWEQKSREWAISDKIVDNEDYSSKYYANISKQNAETATEKADIATNQANIATEKTEEVINSGNTALENISVSSENALNLINTTGQEYLNNTKEYAEKALNSANNASVSETNALEHKNSALNSAQTATEKADIATVQANIAIEKANEALISSQNAKTSETNAKSSETRCEEILSRLGTAIKIKGRVESFSDLPLSGNLDGDTYLVGKDGLDSYPEYYWYEDHWEFLGTSNGGGSWGTITGDIANQEDLQTALDSKQDTLVNQENIKSVNNQSLLGSGNLDIDTLENVTYAELVDLKTNGQLKKGLYYRITDYVTTTNGTTTNSAEPSRSAGHQFDIIVQALGTSDLAEICTACIHENDTYFANENLSAWQIWYDINNDATKYKWAVTDGTGKGVIYRLIDEWGNDCAYDFKNMQFYRDKTLSKYSSLKSYLTATDGYYYTFCDIRNSKISDASITSGKCRANFTDYSTGSNSDGIRRLNNNIFLGESRDYLTINNKLGYDNYNNIFGVATEGCTAGRYFRGNVFGTDIYYFDVGANFVDNIIGSSIYSLKTDNFFRYNTIGNDNGYLIFNGICQNNNIGNHNYGLNFKSQCRYITLGDYCYDCSFGHYNRYNNIGSRATAISFGNEVQNVKTGANAKNINITNGVTGSSSTNLLDLTTLPSQTAYQIDIKMDVNGKVLATWNDLGVTKGKYKDSVTATTWNDINTTISIENWEE